MQKNEDELVSVSDGEVNLWISDGRSLHLKAITKHGDPVELSSEEAKEIAAHLLRLAKAVE